MSGSAAYYSVIEANSGLVMDFDPDEKSKKANQAILDQSKEIAAKLELAGVASITQDPLFQITMHSRQVLELPGFRKINLIPIVAKRNRKKMLNYLSLFLEGHKFARFWTVTSGSRCHVEELRDRIQEIHRKISKLNAAKWFKDSGFSIVIRAEELGEIKRENGNPTYHPHVHLIVVPEKRLEKPDWSEFLSKVHDFFGTVWDDGGEIQDIREVCKYIAKPSHLCALSGKELNALHTALFRLHLVQPMGDLKDEISYLKENRKKVVSIKIPDSEKWKLIVKPDWNRYSKKPKHEQAEEDIFNKTEDDEKPTGKNLILARLAPGPFAGRVFEPAVMVKFFDGNIDAILNHPIVQPYAKVSEALYQQGCWMLEAEEKSARRLENLLEMPPETENKISTNGITPFFTSGSVRSMKIARETGRILDSPGGWDFTDGRSPAIRVHTTTLTVPPENRKKEAPVGNLPSFIGDRKPKEPPDRVAPQNFHEKRQSVSGLPSLIGTGTRPVSKSYAI